MADFRRIRNPTSSAGPIYGGQVITVYDFETRSQVQNETNNAALSSYDDLRYNDDGSVDLYFAPKAPKGYENNWIQTIPGRGWWVWFRFYSPAEAFFDKSW